MQGAWRECMTVTQEKRKFWYDQDAVEGKFKTRDQVLVIACAIPNKLSV